MSYPPWYPTMPAWYLLPKKDANCCAWRTWTEARWWWLMWWDVAGPLFRFAILAGVWRVKEGGYYWTDGQPVHPAEWKWGPGTSHLDLRGVWRYVRR